MTGWTWEYIDEFVTLPRLDALRKYWEKTPPAHVSVAAFFGANTRSTVEEPVKPISNADVVRDMKSDPRKVVWLPVER